MKPATLRSLLIFVFSFSFSDIASAIDSRRVSTGDNKVHAISFSLNGKMIAIACEEGSGGSIRLCSSESLKTIGEMKMQKGTIVCLAFTPDSSLLISGDDDGNVIVWDVAKRRQSSMIKAHRDSIVALAISPNGNQLVTSSHDKTVLLWDLQEQRLLRPLPLNKSVTRAIAYFPNGKVFATGGDDHVVRLWDSKSGKELLSLDRHTEWINSIAPLPNGKGIVTASADGTVKIWEVSIEKLMGDDRVSWDFGRNTPLNLVVTPSGEHVGVGTAGGQIVICATRKDAPIAQVKITAQRFPVFSLALSPDGETLASGSMLEVDATFWKKWPR